MAQKIRIIKAEESDWYSVGEVYEISPVQRYVTTGVEVGYEEEEKTNTVWIVKHGDYEEQVEVKLATTTEEQLFTIVIPEVQLQGKDVYSLLNECIQTISEKTNNVYFPWSELQWSIDIRNTMPNTGKIYICQIFKDSHVHINTTTWMKACQDFVCELQTLLNLEIIKAYSQPIKLYTFTKN